MAQYVNFPAGSIPQNSPVMQQLLGDSGIGAYLTEDKNKLDIELLSEDMTAIAEKLTTAKESLVAEIKEQFPELAELVINEDGTVKKPSEIEALEGIEADQKQELMAYGALYDQYTALQETSATLKQVVDPLLEKEGETTDLSLNDMARVMTVVTAVPDRLEANFDIYDKSEGAKAFNDQFVDSLPDRVAAVATTFGTVTRDTEAERIAERETTEPAVAETAPETASPDGAPEEPDTDQPEAETDEPASEQRRQNGLSSFMSENPLLGLIVAVLDMFTGGSISQMFSGERSRESTEERTAPDPNKELNEAKQALNTLEQSTDVGEEVDTEEVAAYTQAVTDAVRELEEAGMDKAAARLTEEIEASRSEESASGADITKEEMASMQELASAMEGMNAEDLSTLSGIETGGTSTAPAPGTGRDTSEVQR